jgi:hypothetical protein
LAGYLLQQGRHRGAGNLAAGQPPGSRPAGGCPGYAVSRRGRPLSFGAAASVQDGGEIWLDAEVPINRADFGLTWNLLGLVSMNNTLTIHAVFTRR